MTRSKLHILVEKFQETKLGKTTWQGDLERGGRLCLKESTEERITAGEITGGNSCDAFRFRLNSSSNNSRAFETAADTGPGGISGSYYIKKIVRKNISPV
jgi:hypothetical protein